MWNTIFNNIPLVSLEIYFLCEILIFHCFSNNEELVQDTLFKSNYHFTFSQIQNNPQNHSFDNLFSLKFKYKVIMSIHEKITHRMSRKLNTKSMLLWVYQPNVELLLSHFSTLQNWVMSNRDWLKRLTIPFGNLHWTFYLWRMWFSVCPLKR